MLASSRLLFGLMCLVGLAGMAASDILVDDQLDVYPPGVTAAYLLRLRGFVADEFNFTTNSGYILTITRGRSPMFEQRLPSCREPILFLHGVLGNANNFLLNSQGIKPKNLSGISFDSMSMDEAVAALQDEPSARALPFLAMNRGCHVWHLARRGTPGSERRKGDPLSVQSGRTPTNPLGNTTLGGPIGSVANLLNLTETLQGVALTLDVGFWNYSLDEQCADDFPVAIDFVLSNSPGASQVSILGHSAGGAMALMGLSLMSPEMRKKVAVAVLWAPAYATSNDNPKFDLLFGPLIPVVSTYIGPLLLPPFLVNPVIGSLQTLCTPPVTWTTICELGYDQFFGDSGGQQPMTPQLVDFGPYSAASHELAQLGQTIFYPPNHTVRYFDFGPFGNQNQYNRIDAPAYSLSNISSSPKLSFYAGRTDFLVTPADVQMARGQLTVLSQYHLVNTTFNHIGYFNHIRNAILAIIPSMYELQTLARRVASRSG